VLTRSVELSSTTMALQSFSVPLVLEQSIANRLVNANNNTIFVELHKYTDHTIDLVHHPVVDSLGTATSETRPLAPD
jgi:hypothetical protein